jgi:murein DD-endopeptidase MepM/ murein hydrolase activator NlpD
MAGFLAQRSMSPSSGGPQVHGAALLKGQDLAPLGRVTAGPMQPASAAAAGGRYQVKAGDSLWKIARDHNLDWRELARLNNIDNPSLIRVGQEIVLPSGSTAAAGPAAGRPQPAVSRPASGVAAPAPAAMKPAASPASGAVPPAGAPRAPGLAQRSAAPGAPVRPAAAPQPARRPVPVAGPFAASPAAAPELARSAAAFAPRTAAPAAQAQRPAPASGVGSASAPQAASDSLKAFGLTETTVDQILDRTSRYEGEYTSLNRNTDKAGLSFGFIQFAQKPGSLGQVLGAMARKNPAKFSQIFGSEAQEMLKVVTKGPDHGVDAQGRATNPRFDLTREPWLSRFEAAGRDPEFQGVQRQVARKHYFNPMLEVAQQHGIKSPEGLSMLFDTSVQQGRNGMERILRHAAKRRTPGMGEREFLELVAKTAAKAAGPRWQRNVLQRRMGILQDPEIAKLGKSAATAQG